MDNIELENIELFATLSKTDTWRLQRHYFPSKLGGFPAWLDPVNLPKESELSCDKCSNIMTFVIQVYSPDDLCEENESFHRTIFLFVCQPCGNQWKVFRSQLARNNPFYEFHPLEDNILIPDTELTKRCCLACGLPSDNPATEPIPELNTMKIQLLDTGELRELHNRCKIAIKYKTLNTILDEWILNICEGEIPISEDYYSHEKALYNKYLKEKKLNGETMDESEEQAFESIQEENLILDKSFLKFSKKTTPNEVLYYHREGEPLWISDKTPRPIIIGLENNINNIYYNNNNFNELNDNIKKSIENNENIVPLCENCGNIRSFEFQILPQIIHYINSDRIEFASILVYTCSKSCKIINKYQKEIVIVEKDCSLIPKTINNK